MADRCPSCTATTPIGVEVCGVYDGVLYWHCAQCGADYHRWPEGSPLWKRADWYVAMSRPTGGTR